MLCDETCIMVLKNCGPKGYPGMAEVGNMTLPAKILKRGITDMVRISDARMSGTAYGTVVLPVAPEAAAGGPLALVESGDMIAVDVQKRSLHLEVPAEELESRKAEWKPSEVETDREYVDRYGKGRWSELCLSALLPGRIAGSKDLADQNREIGVAGRTLYLMKGR